MMRATPMRRAGGNARAAAARFTHTVRISHPLVLARACPSTTSLHHSQQRVISRSFHACVVRRDSSANGGSTGAAEAEAGGSSVGESLPRSVFTTPNQVPGQYAEVFRASLEDPNGFWKAAAREIRWTSKGTRALTPPPPGAKPHNYKWFGPDEAAPSEAGRVAPVPSRWELNACDNMLDVHVDSGRGDRIALIHDSAITGEVRRISYREMRDEVSRLAGALRHAGVNKGDRVLVYMPAIPETVQAMLAIVRLGAIHCVVFGGFASSELAKRINDCKPDVILTASCGMESKTKIVPYKPALDEAIDISKYKPRKVLMFQRPQLQASMVPGRDEDWKQYVRQHGVETAPVPVPATHPLYILYTSGTTGTPKGVVRDTGSITALKMSMSMIYGHKADEVFWSASDLGWAVGHSYILYGPFLQGSTSVMFEGKPVGTPDAGAFWRVIEQHRVSVLFTAPTALRAIKKEDSEGKLLPKYDVSSFKALYLAGERADPASVDWARKLLKVPVIDHWWQTETGWGIVANPRGLESIPVKDGSASLPVPGWDVRVLDDEGHEVPRGVQGNLVVRLPIPPGGVQELWGNRARFEAGYINRFPGFYDTSDAGRIDEDNYVYIMSRTDDVMNVAGHRLSTGQIEEVLADHPSVAECAVVAFPDELRGHVPVGLVVLKTGQTLSAETIEREIVAAVRHRVGAVAMLRRVVVVQRLPKTRSGKVLRNVLRSMTEGRTRIHPTPATIEDPAVLHEIHTVMHKHGLASKPDHPDVYSSPPNTDAKA